MTKEKIKKIMRDNWQKNRRLEKGSLENEIKEKTEKKELKSWP